jgi:hypothetical protein
MWPVYYQPEARLAETLILFNDNTVPLSQKVDVHLSTLALPLELLRVCFLVGRRLHSNDSIHGNAPYVDQNNQQADYSASLA